MKYQVSTGCFNNVSTDTDTGIHEWRSGSNKEGFEFNASASNNIYGNSSTVTPNSLITNFYISY